MQPKTWIMLIVGTLVTGAYLILSSLIRETETIWLLTRLFGIISFITLFIVVLLGEVRLLSKDKSKVTLFRYHKPLAIFATYLVFLHFISAVADDYKWGRGLQFTQYLGFSFGDQWLVLLSLGTLAFYLMLIIGMTSATKSIQLLGFKRWKIIHFLSYAVFVIAFIHSVNLGTDIKHSVLAPYLKPVILTMFALVTGLLLVRAVAWTSIFEDQWEVNLAAVLILFILVLSAMIAQRTIGMERTLKETSARAATASISINAQEERIALLQARIDALTGSGGAAAGKVE
ncbi:TPA: hypothetical protein HA251_05470 [Candidatus Woesearchaeota archaeon]|nr:hypothetical protein [Candidatus Woesearchaeota archaeon]